MTKPSGVFSTKGTYYKNNERCRWKFEVEKRKVRAGQCGLEGAGYIE